VLLYRTIIDPPSLTGGTVTQGPSDLAGCHGGYITLDIFNPQELLSTTYTMNEQAVFSDVVEATENL